MYIKDRINWRISYLTRCVIICISLCILSACSDELIDSGSPTDDYATILLTIRTPAASTPQSITKGLRNTIVGETTISNVKVLVFSDPQGNGNYRFSYYVDGTQLENPSGQASRFQVLLRSSSVPIKLYLVANYAEAFNTYTPAAGDDEASVKRSVTMNFPENGMTEILPMYGEVSLQGLDAATTTMLDATVLRAVARVDVKKELAENSRDFDLREVHLFRVSNRIQIIPDAISTDGTLRVTAPSIPAGNSRLAQPLVKTATATTDSIGGLYLPESVAISQQEGGWQQVTTVVVGGVFDDNDAVTYYRVDFNSGIEGHPFGQVLRNYLYTFIIQDVMASGWLTAEEAAINQASSMTVEIQQWEDFTTDMYFHEDYIGVSTRQVNVPFLPHYTKQIDVDASMNYEIEWVNAPDSGSVSDANVPLSDGYFTATIIHNAGESSYLSHIRIESPQYNITDQPVQSTLRLTAQGTSVDIAVIKESPSQYSGRTLRVLSVGWSYGSLGSYNNTAVYSLAMRNVLDTNFSPSSSYPFKTGGFFFLAIDASSALYSAATDPANVASFKRLINSFDVLIMSYENTTSTQVTNMLLDEWLVENPHRVLWVMRDDAISNVNIVARTAQDGEGVWNNIGNAFDATAGYRYSNSADYAYDNAQEVYEFFNGPFGTIDNQNTQLSLRAGDIVSGASLIPDSSKQYVTPILYSNKPGYTDYMSIGINKNRGIIYQGEAQFFQAGIGMNNTTGTITTTTDTNGQYYYDMLNANIWAWVTGRVIYGPAE